MSIRRRILFHAALLVSAAAPALGQDSVVVTPGPVELSPLPPRIRFIVSGGMALPTGGFSTYHDLGPQVAASAVIRLFGQKLRLRPEAIYAQLGVLEDKVRALVSSGVQVPGSAGAPGGSAAGAGPKLPDLRRLRDRSISSLLATFANIELPLGPRGFQPYVIGGVGAVSFRTDVTTVGQALDGVQWGLNAGAGLRVRLGRLGGGIEARFRDIPIDGTRTFFDQVTTVPIAFSLVF